MVLCERHCSGVKPAVDNLWYTMHGLTALRTFHGQLIDVRTMQLHRFCSLITGFFK